MRGRYRAGQGGFTLIELLVTLTLLVVLLRLAMPSFSSAALSSRLTSYANDFVASAHMARSEALKRNAQVTLCRSADGATCASEGSWEQGWIVMCRTDSADPNICKSDGTDVLVLQKHSALSSGYRFTTGTSVYSVVFPGGGVGATQITAVLCRIAPDVGDQERRIDITAGGRTAVTTTRTSTCA